ncbi:MAG: L-lactate permease [Chloroflexi bacterium]|nr:L-lactate permease [Chloroflexota bacterium]
MDLPFLTIPNVLAAAAPILVVLYLMVGRHWPGERAGVVGWVTAVCLSLLFFGANLPLLWVAVGRAVLLSLFVLYIIWMALLLYHTVNEAGAIEAIGRELPLLTQDKAAQALLLAWIFGSFLQGASGYGVPAAVVAPLLLALGFGATEAVTMALIGHAWAVTFGSLGSSFLSLVAATGLPGEELAGPTAVMLAVCCLGSGLSVLWLAGGSTAVRQRGLFLLGMTAVMAGTQWAAARAGLWTLAAFGAGLAGLVAAIFLFTRRRPAQTAGFQARRFAAAFAPYAILIGVVLIGQFVLGDFLGQVQINAWFPGVTTDFGWQTAAGPGRSIDLFGHGGALLLYASLLAFAWFRWRGVFPAADGRLRVYDGRTMLRRTWRGSLKPTVGIFTLVAMATVMQHAGMTQLLAVALSSVAGPVYPLVSPFIGALGAFMTGSNTNSNVVFGELQRQTAVTLGLPVPIILAAQTAGGAVGSTFAPAKVIVGCSTAPGADDGRVLRLTAVYGLGIILAVALVAWLLA